MARGGNDKPRINNPTTTTQHDNHSLSTSTSTTTTTITSSQQSIPSTRNDPRVVHDSETGIEDSFNNYGKGSQNSSDSTMISSGSGENRSSATATRSAVIGNSCSGTKGSFNNYKKGSQDFTGAKVNSGQNSGEVRGVSNQDNPSDNHFSGSPSSSRCYLRSYTKIARIFSGENSGNRRGQEHAVHCSGTLDSFNNHGKGSQDFSHAKINSGGNSWDI